MLDDSAISGKDDWAVFATDPDSMAEHSEFRVSSVEDRGLGTGRGAR